MLHEMNDGQRRAGHGVDPDGAAVLRPLSGEFLYRSPHDAFVHDCRWQRRPSQEKAHGTD